MNHDVKRRIGVYRCRRPRYFVGRNWKAHDITMKRGTMLLYSKRRFGVTAWMAIKGGECLYLWPDCETIMEVDVKKRRATSAEASASLHLAAVESNLFHKHLPIVQHCCHTQYDDQSPRKPGWVTIKTLGSAWVVEAKDPDSCCKLTVVQQSLDDALALLSVLLEAEEAPWENDPWLKQQGTKKKAG